MEWSLVELWLAEVGGPLVELTGWDVDSSSGAGSEAAKVVWGFRNCAED